MKKYILSTALLIALTLSSGYIMAQNAPGFDDDVEDTPVDGGIATLVVGAAAFGYRQIKKHNQKNRLG
jgi:hypothetical protein